MPEGDTILHAARRVGGALLGREILAIETPQRHLHDRWPERLTGRAVRSVDSHGKHLFVRFEGDITLHSHLRMGGKWAVYRRGERWRRSPHRAWLVVRTAEHDVVQFDGPVLELMTESRTRFDQRLAALGPDILGASFDEAGIVRCARPLMQASAEHGGTRSKPRVYERSGRPCPRCGTIVQARGQGDDNRTTFWCPGCQR